MPTDHSRPMDLAALVTAARAARKQTSPEQHAMDYLQHLKLHQQRLDREQQAEAAEDAKRVVALTVRCETAQGLIRQTIVPELEAIETAIRGTGRRDCTVKVSKQKFEGIETEFEAEVQLRHDSAKLRFAADPAKGIFEVTATHGSGNKTSPQQLRYDEVTAAAVQDHCARFMTLAFPI